MGSSIGRQRKQKNLTVVSERKLAVGCIEVAKSAFEGVRERRRKVDTPAMHSLKQAGSWHVVFISY